MKMKSKYIMHNDRTGVVFFPIIGYDSEQVLQPARAFRLFSGKPQHVTNKLRN